MVRCPGPAPRNFAASRRLPIVADKPIRRVLTPASRLRRSIRQKVCPPRSLRKKEWSSSITTKRRPWKRWGMSICLLIIKDSSDSGVICKTPDGCFNIFRFCVAATSPCQRHTGISESASHSPSPFANYQAIEQRTGTPVYFAHAYSPHERGSNENRNRVLRRFIPKGQAMEELSDHKLIQINWYLNSRPLKCLNWRTPIEIFLLNLRH